MTTLLISGTDTGVGKTIVVSALAAYLQTFCTHQRFALFKPLQSGQGDREQYRQQFQLSQTLDQINPLYFETPIAPPLAAEAEGKPIDLGLAWNTFQTLQKNYDRVLVEGVGGLGSPITAELTVADLAHDWHLPTVLVVPVQLGAIGQAIANAALVQQAQVNLLGIILSCSQPCSAQDIEQWANPELIQSFTQRPILGTLPYQANLTDLTTLAKTAASWDLEVLFPQIYASTKI